MVGPLDNIIGLRDARTTATKLVQFARGVPGLTTVLLGQKVSRSLARRPGGYCIRDRAVVACVRCCCNVAALYGM